MKTSITKIIEKFQGQIEEIFRDEEKLSISAAEKAFRAPTQEFLCGLMQEYYECIDEALRLDKSSRKGSSLIIERRNDIRQVLTEFGNLAYRRTYYFSRKENRYEYPVDQVAGLEGYERISAGVGLNLATAACAMSYGNSSNFATGNKVSRQTVMHKVRSSEPVVKEASLRNVPVLHIDADEDHVTLTGGKNTIVPLISVYEGIEKKGKRGVCKNVFHISEYGKRTDELWEQALDELERRYDLNGTKIYLHGDGASWVYSGLDWLPNSQFVLDKYHRNKAIKQMLGGLDSSMEGSYTAALKKALFSKDCVKVAAIAEKCITQNPEREENIRVAAGYLIDFQDAIAITESDEEANNGGCTEPHVSNILSRRLSNRPMAWSKETLRSLAPMLASGRTLCLIKKNQVMASPALATAARAASKAVARAAKPQYTAGLPVPDTAVSLTVLKNGKVTNLFQTLNSISNL